MNYCCLLKWCLYIRTGKANTSVNEPEQSKVVDIYYGGLNKKKSKYVNFFCLK